MNFPKYYNKKISGLLILIIFISNSLFFTQNEKVEAQGIPVYDNALFLLQTTFNNTTAAYQAKKVATPSIWEIGRKLGVEPALAAAAKVAARKLIDALVQATVEWINSGFQGQPAFIADPGKFLSDAGDELLGDMVFKDPDLNFLCSPFQLQVRASLVLGFNGGDLKKRLGCTLTGVINNVQNANVGVSASVNVGANERGITASAGAGRSGDLWDDWIQVTTQPQNNPVGAYLITKSELDTRIASRQDSITKELNWGQGALSFNQCTEITYDSSGNVKNTRKYMGSKNYKPDEKLPDFSQNLVTKERMKTTCVVKTPGATITDMLGFKATSNQRVGELQAALSDGIDQIFSALVGQLISMGIDQVQKGVLGDSSASSDYRSQLDTLPAQIQAQYNAQMSGIQSASADDSLSSYLDDQNEFNAYDALFGAGYGQGFVVTRPQSTGQSTAGCSFDNLAVPRAAALTRISSLNDSETNYQNTYITATDILTQARAIFATSTACNIRSNTATGYLRAQIINANVITNIDGRADSGRSIASIPWNLSSITALMNVSNAHITLLNTARDGVNAVPTNVQNVVGITDAMIPVNSTSFNTDPEREIVDNIKTWLRSVRNNYSTVQCPINLDPVLNIQAPAIVVTPIAPSAQCVGGIPTVAVTPTTATLGTSNIPGPRITYTTPTSVRVGGTVTINGSQLLFGAPNTIILDGATIQNDVYAPSNRNLSLSFALPTSVTLGTHSLSVRNVYGTSNAVNITVIRALVYTCYPYQKIRSHTWCNWTGGGCQEIIDEFKPAYCAYE